MAMTCGCMKKTMWFKAKNWAYCTFHQILSVLVRAPYLMGTPTVQLTGMKLVRNHSHRLRGRGTQQRRSNKTTKYGNIKTLEIVSSIAGDPVGGMFLAVNNH